MRRRFVEVGVGPRVGGGGGTGIHTTTPLLILMLRHLRTYYNVALPIIVAEDPLQRSNRHGYSSYKYFVRVFTR